MGPPRSAQGTYEDNNSVHIVMTLCEGGELFDSIVKAGTFSEKKAAKIFRDMVDTVRRCHELGVMHRDLKPENFLLTSKDPESQVLKLTDFGLGCFFQKDEVLTECVGSPYYIAPEVLNGKYTYKADMWSLGVILYIMLSGQQPFWGDTHDQIYSMAKQGKLDFKSKPWPRLSEECKDCIRKLCVVDAKERASAAEILHHPWLQIANVSDEPFEGEVIQRLKGFAATNRMKKTAMLVLGQSLEPFQIAGMRHLFRTIDADGNGFITISELRKALADWGHQIDPVELNKAFEISDVDGNGSIDYNEFVAATMHVSKLQKEELLKKAFACFDENGDGRITEEELKHVLERFHLTDSAAELLKSADRDNDGTIDFDEFRAMMRSKKGAEEDDSHMQSYVAAPKRSRRV